MDDSLASAEENNQPPNNLFQEINRINTDDWRQEELAFSPHASFHASFDHPHHDASFDSPHHDSSFAHELPLQSKICEDLLDLQDVLETTHREAFESQPAEPPSKSEEAPSPVSQPSLPSQVTITLHEESIASKILQDETQDDSSFSTSLRSFLSLNDKNYRPHVTCLKFLFSKLKDYSRQSLQNLKLHIHFLEVKLKQETRCLQAELGEERGQGQAGGQGQGEAGEEEDVNIDEKVVMEVMVRARERRLARRKSFCGEIREIQEELLGAWRKTKERRERRERWLEEEVVRVIDRIELEMEDMIKCRLLSDRQQDRLVSDKIKSRNPFLTRDKYLEMKYLIQRENAYLRLIADFNAKLTAYMVAMFAKEEPLIARLIQEALADYSSAFMRAYGHSDLLALKLHQLEGEAEAERRLKLELADLLLSFIPRELYDIAQSQPRVEQSGDRLEAILGDFSNSLQNTIFITTIQMNNEFILFRNEATWKTTKSLFHRPEDAPDYESRQALALSKTTHTAHAHAHAEQQRDARIVVVLTSNYYLHLQDEDKVATVCLGEVKLSKRGREVIIADRGKGIGGYLGLKSELGRLEFDTSEEVEIFAQKLSLALRRIAG